MFREQYLIDIKHPFSNDVHLWYVASHCSPESQLVEFFVNFYHSISVLDLDRFIDWLYLGANKVVHAGRKK